MKHKVTVERNKNNTVRTIIEVTFSTFGEAVGYMSRGGYINPLHGEYDEDGEVVRSVWVHFEDTNYTATLTH